MPPEANPLIPTELIENLSRLPMFSHVVKPSILWALIALMILDVLTGLVAAAVHKDVDSSSSYSGILKKCQMLLIVGAGTVFEMIYPDVPWGRLIAGLLCISEMTSIIENAGKAGVPLPVQLTETLRRLRASEKEDQAAASKVIVKVQTPAPTEVVTDVVSEESKS